VSTVGFNAILLEAVLEVFEKALHLRLNVDHAVIIFQLKCWRTSPDTVLQFKHGLYSPIELTRST
jgi:hypothetical protein